MWEIRIISGDIIIDYTYEYDKQNLGIYKTLDDLPSQKNRLKQMAIIMNNSGYENTEAVRWILNDM